MVKIAAVGALAALVGLGTTPAGATMSHKKPKHHKKHLPTPHVGQVAKDGDFAFKVTQVRCGETSLGTTPITDEAPAGSQWCLVSMNVKDDKATAQTFFASNQYAIDARGQQLSATSGAIIYVGNDSQAEATQVNPGVSITVVVPFELATSDAIKKFVLHDSAFSGGVTVYNVG